MPQTKLLVSDEVANLIKYLHPDLKKRVKKAFAAILEKPNRGKTLKDELAGLLSYRVKRFRIIYRIGPRSKIEIVALGPRKYIYEETFKIISKEGKKRTYHKSGLRIKL